MVFRILLPLPVIRAEVWGKPRDFSCYRIYCGVTYPVMPSLIKVTCLLLLVLDKPDLEWTTPHNWNKGTRLISQLLYSFHCTNS